VAESCCYQSPGSVAGSFSSFLHLEEFRRVTDGARTRDLLSATIRRQRLLRVAARFRIGLFKVISLLTVACCFRVLRSEWCRQWCQKGLLADEDLCGFIALLRVLSKGRRSKGRVSAPQPTFVLWLESPWYQYLSLPTLSSREPIDGRIVPVTRSLASCFWFSRYGNDYPGTICALSSLSS
jgi:hypothetical protein